MKNSTSWKNKTAKTEHLKLLIDSKKMNAINYSKELSFEVGDYVDHFKFGPGFVQAVINDKKVEVFFEDSEKIMLQNWK